MKTPLVLIASFALLAGAFTAQAGPRVSVWINAGGGACGPRYVAPPPPVCYAPPPVVYYRPRAVYYAPPPPVYYAPPPRRVYRAPVVRGEVVVSSRAYGWR